MFIFRAELGDIRFRAVLNVTERILGTFGGFSESQMKFFHSGFNHSNYFFNVVIATSFVSWLAREILDFLYARSEVEVRRFDDFLLDIITIFKLVHVFLRIMRYDQGIIRVY